ncbi:cobalt-precorrin-6A reductase [Actinocrispum sp. NPDC049592]|uniref:cobalt-precorrin-6A reductase n=1 Tax=Actinocrispum sp. NPDC049592 TaxID=3154835 RepID=UPI003415C407
MPVACAGDLRVTAVLILGGTGEGRRLADQCVGLSGISVVSSLAGRVRSPKVPQGEVRIGGFGGETGFRDWVIGHGIDAVVDATHPFASVMTGTAAKVTGELGIPFVVLRRPGWAEQPGDRWHWVDSVAAAAEALGDETAFLTTGREELKAFAHLPNRFVVRSVDPPEPPMPSNLYTVLDRGPFTVEGERRLMREHAIEVLVTKDSGGDMTSAKLQAARELRLPVIMVRRPPLPDVETVDSVAAAVRWLGTVAG